MILRESDILELYSRAKNEGKHSTRIKVWQYEVFEGKRPKMYVQTVGLDKIKANLEKLNCRVDFNTTDKQVTVGYNAKGEINKLVERKLHTTNMLIEW